MNTPAHAVINWLILGRRDRPELAAPIVAGSVLPDLSMILFYIYHKAHGTQESVIWSVHYHQRQWQAFFDVLNSMPIILIGLAVAWRLRAMRWCALFAAMGLHVLFDLPVHNEDAHRHFFPLSDWRFHSPLSYWDSRYHGDVVGAMEIAVVVVGGFVLWRRFPGWQQHMMCAGLCVAYALHWIYVLSVWA